MPKGRVPSLLSINNGGILYSVAVRSGKCTRCKGSLVSSEKIGLLKYQQGGFVKEKRLCLKCVSGIIEKTQADLDQIRLGLSNSVLTS